MRFGSELFGLPTPILTLLLLHFPSAYANSEPEPSSQWPWNLPKHVKYWPEDPPTRRRDLEAIEEHVRLGRSPVALMKMPADEGAKFYMEYWQFGEDNGQMNFPGSLGLEVRGNREEEAGLLANASLIAPYQPPYALHSEKTEFWDLRSVNAVRAKERRHAVEVKAILEQRGFACPTGTSDCSAVGYGGYCCATGETCFAVQDTGLGPVGCCPTGSTCGGAITSCNAPNTACDDSVGGACCIANYVCANPIGCVVNPSLIVTVVVTQTQVLSSSSQTTIVITTITTATSTTPTSTSQSTLACSSGFQACPMSLGGGCCATDAQCASSSCIVPASSSTVTTTTVSATATRTASTATGVAPVRPTSDSSISAAPSITGTSCPTGFYACSAYYAGGCCRTGRNCDTTSCPATSSTTIVSGGQTIVVPVGTAATVANPMGACATGWTSCAASVGGDCCPSGYACGTASCSSVGATSTAEVQKGSPNAGVKNMELRFLGVVLATLAIVLALL